MSNQNLKALMSSEIFRNFAALELKKQAKPQEDTFEQFLAFQDKIRENPDLKKYFLNMQTKIASDTSFRNRLSSKFIEAISMLDLEDV